MAEWSEDRFEVTGDPKRIGELYRELVSHKVDGYGRPFDEYVPFNAWKDCLGIDVPDDGYGPEIYDVASPSDGVLSFCVCNNFTGIDVSYEMSRRCGPLDVRFSNVYGSDGQTYPEHSLTYGEPRHGYLRLLGRETDALAGLLSRGPVPLADGRVVTDVRCVRDSLDRRTPSAVRYSDGSTVSVDDVDDVTLGSLAGAVEDLQEEGRRLRELPELDGMLYSLLSSRGRSEVASVAGDVTRNARPATLLRGAEIEGFSRDGETSGFRVRTALGSFRTSELSLRELRDVSAVVMRNCEVYDRRDLRAALRELVDVKGVAGVVDLDMGAFPGLSSGGERIPSRSRLDAAGWSADEGDFVLMFRSGDRRLSVPVWKIGAEPDGFGAVRRLADAVRDAIPQVKENIVTNDKGSSMENNGNISTPEGMRELTKDEMAQTVGGVEVSPFNDKLVGIAQDLAIEFTVGGDRFDRDDIALALYEAGLKVEQLPAFRDYIRKLPQCEFPYEAEIEMRLNAGEERILHGLSDSFDPAIESLEDQREAHIDFIEKELKEWLPDDVLEMGRLASLERLAAADSAQQEGSVSEEVRLSISSPSGGTLLDEVARIFPDETGREPVCVERLRNGNSVSVYDGFEYDIVANAMEVSSNRVHAVETAPDGQLVGSYFLVGNSYGDLKDGPELSRTGDGWVYRINGAIRISDEYLSSNGIIFDRDGNLDWGKTEREKDFGDFYISPEEELARICPSWKGAGEAVGAVGAGLLSGDVDAGEVVALSGFRQGIEELARALAMEITVGGDRFGPQEFAQVLVAEKGFEREAFRDLVLKEAAGMTPYGDCDFNHEQVDIWLDPWLLKGAGMVNREEAAGGEVYSWSMLDSDLYGVVRFDEEAQTGVMQLLDSKGADVADGLGVLVDVDGEGFVRAHYELDGENHRLRGEGVMAGSDDVRSFELDTRTAEISFVERKSRGMGM